jgi:hypothetical protein
MQPWKSVAKLSLLGAVALGVASCGEATKTQQGGSAQVSKAGTVEDTGKRLSGDFVLSEVEDAYGRANPQSRAQTILSFDEKGSLKRQERSRVDEGTYLIEGRSELVIYIEKVNGEQLEAARIERYRIFDESGDTITLQSASQKLTFQKR